MSKGEKIMSNDQDSGDLFDYAKENLLVQMREKGLTEENIEALIAAIPPFHPLRPHFVSQFIEGLDPGERIWAAQRLFPKFSGHTVTINILTLPDKPSFKVPADMLSASVARLILDAFGLQKDGDVHMWGTSTR